MLTLLGIALFVLYCLFAGMKRGWWEHMGQYLETGTVFLLTVFLSGSLIASIGAALLGNFLFQGFTNLSFKRPFIYPAETWFWDFKLSETKVLWIPRLPGYWRIPQALIGLLLILWRIL